MSQAAKIKLDSRFKKQIKGVIEKYEFEVGIEEGTHFAAQRGKKGLHGTDVVSQYAGGPVRKIDRSKPDGKNADIAESFRKHLGINFWTAPFEKKSSDILKFLDNFFKYAFGKSEKQRLINSLQAVVRNPFMSKDYGPNSKITQAIKTFDRLGIDTAQMFKSIKADVRKKSS
jgi:hypothetical protein